jgi:glutathione peroxidase
MTIKQRILKIIYPLLMKSKDKAIVLMNEKSARPAKSFFDLKALRNNNALMSFETLKGKKTLIVNTATGCGYTAQFDDLETLYETQKDKLNILAFPANDFGKQEQKSNDEIAKFCKMNFGVSFSIMKKSTVVKDSTQNEVYKWLTDKNENGWNEQAPVWNFSKYLIDENGVLINFFGTSVSPLSDEVLKAIKA